MGRESERRIACHATLPGGIGVGACAAGRHDAGFLTVVPNNQLSKKSTYLLQTDYSVNFPHADNQEFHLRRTELSRKF